MELHEMYMNFILVIMRKLWILNPSQWRNCSHSKLVPIFAFTVNDKTLEERKENEPGY
jgi:hypothetical protein